jgi:hypothetical protein
MSRQRVETLAERYERTMLRLENITRTGYQVEVVWEYEFDESILTQHSELQTHPQVEHSPLNTRDDLYGGGTEAMRLYYKTQKGETVEFVEVMSLYHYVCKYFKFPLWHPTIHVGDIRQDIEAMFKKEGLRKCSILPPERLYHPVLPFPANGKLLFCLCKTRAMETNTKFECKHLTVREIVW